MTSATPERMTDEDEVALVERIASAICSAENGLDGDTIGTMLHGDFRVEVHDGDKGMGDLRTACLRAAQAAVNAIEHDFDRLTAERDEARRERDELVVEAERDGGGFGFTAEARREYARAESLLAALTEDRLIIEAAYVALGPGCRFMDPPDGGSPTLADQINNMRDLLEAAERERDEADDAWVDALKYGQESIENWRSFTRERARAVAAEAALLAAQERVRTARREGVVEGLDVARIMAENWTLPPVVKLAAGEMKPGELRSVQAAMRGLESAIRDATDRARQDPASGQGEGT